ncbi:hypothetical protein D5S17_16185 [Pseudonocardiaceae bacterium YIM PH 21723]|nr:hypothetical protein D5S17_16185 [Pseudonocardiaceae bacterium YIM PH 21723]
MTDARAVVLDYLTRGWAWLVRNVIPVLISLGVLITVMGGLLVVGAATNDYAINRHQGRAVAEVLAVDWRRTVIRFSTPEGEVKTPPFGALYPSDVQKGQLIWVEYDTRNPDLVRIAGRDWRLSLLPVAELLAATWTVVLGLIWWLRRRRSSGVSAPV